MRKLLKSSMNLLNVANSVVTSLLGQGTIATSHPLFLGMGGMHGSFAANIAMTEADFMISIEFAVSMTA